VNTPRNVGVLLNCSLNFETECQRLCDGFTASLQNLRIGETISDMFGVAKPEWEKSPGLVVNEAIVAILMLFFLRMICSAFIPRLCVLMPSF